MNKIAAEWTNKAEQSFRVSHFLTRSPLRPLNDHICFYSNKCISQYLKAYLTSRKIRFPRTRDIQVHLSFACRKDPSFWRIQKQVEILATFDMKILYPGERAFRSEARTAFKAMDVSRRFIRKRLQSRPTF